MANHNEKATLSPKGVEPEQDEDVEAGDDEQLVNVLTTSLSSVKKRAPRPSGFLGTFKSLLGYSREQPVKDMFYPSKESTDKKDGPEDADADEEHEVDDPKPNSPEKRKRDVYEVPDGSKREKDVQTPAQKKHRTTRQAKEPLVIVLPNSPRAAVLPNRQTRSSRRLGQAGGIEAEEPESNPSKSISATQKDSRQSGTGDKPRRGRPPKQKPAPGSDPATPQKSKLSMKRGRHTKKAAQAHVSNDLQTPQDIGGRRDGEAEESLDAEQNKAGEAKGTQAQDASLAVDGSSGLFLDPSPARAIPPKNHSRRTAKQMKMGAQVPRSKDGPSNEQPLEIQQGSLTDNTEGSDSELDVEDKLKEDVRSRPSGNVEDERETECSDADGSLETIHDLISVGDVEDMLEKVRRVGFAQNRETKEWEQRRTELVPLSVPGKRVLERLALLIQTCNNLQAARRSQDELVERTARKQAAEQIARVIEESQVIFEERLGNPALGIPWARDDLTRVMLTDIYFILVPKLVEALLGLVEANKEEEAAEVGSVRAVSNLLDLLQKLAESALNQKTQPKAPEKNTYHFQNATRSVMPQIRKLNRNVKKKLQVLERACTILDWNKKALERQRRRKELDKKREEEIDRQMRDKARARKEYFDRGLRSDPILNRLVQVDLREQAARRREAAELQMARSSQRAHGNPGPARVQTQVAETEEDDDPFREEEAERIKILPRHNKLMRDPKPLTRAEKLVFIHIMQFKDKDIRYEVAAKRLGRSPEEIFGCAKTLQEAMDGAHERGENNSLADEWTYDIYR